MSNIIPLAEMRELTEQRRKRELEALLTPAKASEVQKLVATLSGSLALMPSLLDPAAFTAALAKFFVAGNYSLHVLQELYQRAVGPGGFENMPSIAKLIALADEIEAPWRNELSEVSRRLWEREERQRRCTAFQNRLAVAIGDAAPSLDDIELAARLVRDLRRARMTNMPSWTDFATEDPQACAELCKRLAAVARAEFPDYSHSREIEIQQLLVVAAQERERKHWLGVEQQARARLGNEPLPPGDLDPNKEKEAQRQKVMRFIVARYTGDDLTRRMNGMMGLDETHDDQWWFDECDAEMTRADWDDVHDAEPQWKRLGDRGRRR